MSRLTEINKLLINLESKTDVIKYRGLKEKEAQIREARSKRDSEELQKQLLEVQTNILQMEASCSEIKDLLQLEKEKQELEAQEQLSASASASTLVETSLKSKLQSRYPTLMVSEVSKQTKIDVHTYIITCSTGIIFTVELKPTKKLPSAGFSITTTCQPDICKIGKNKLMGEDEDTILINATEAIATTLQPLNNPWLNPVGANPFSLRHLREPIKVNGSNAVQVTICDTMVRHEPKKQKTVTAQYLIQTEGNKTYTLPISIFIDAKGEIGGFKCGKQENQTIAFRTETQYSTKLYEELLVQASRQKQLELPNVQIVNQSAETTTKAPSATGHDFN